MSKPFRADLEAGLELQRAGRLEEAEAIYGRVVALSPNLAEGWHMLGLVRHQQNDFQGAADAINRAISLDSTQAVFFNNYGAALQGIKRCADAVAAYRAALQIRPIYYDAQLNLVRALNQLDQPKAAHAFARDSLAAHPEKAELLQQAVRAALGAGIPADAVTWLESLIALAHKPATKVVAKDHVDWLLQLGTLLNHLRREREAVPRLQEALALQPDQAEISYQLALALAACGELPAARMAIQHGCRLAPEKTAWQLREQLLAPAAESDRAELEAYENQLESWLDGRLQSGETYERGLLFEAEFIPPRCLAGSPSGRRIKEKFAALVRPSFPQVRWPRIVSGKTRLGFVVTPGHEREFVREWGSILRSLDRSHFNVVLACSQVNERPLLQSIGTQNLETLPLGPHFQQNVRLLADAACDVLYFWQAGSDVLTYYLPLVRLAPVQCASSDRGTTGLQEIDFLLAPAPSPASPGDYTEQLGFLNGPATQADHDGQRSDAGTLAPTNSLAHALIREYEHFFERAAALAKTRRTTAN